MRIILMFLFALPLVILLVGSFFGQLRVFRALVFFVLWLAASEILMFTALVHITNPASIFWFACAVLMVALAIPAAVLFSAATSKPITPAPAEIFADVAVDIATGARQIYDGLDEDDKQALRAASRMGVKLGLAGFADFLRHKRWRSAASLLKEAATSL